MPKIITKSISSSLTAQSYSAQWFTMINALSALHISNTTNSIYYLTALTSNGYIGIGTNNPLALLHVNGSISAQSITVLETVSAGTLLAGNFQSTTASLLSRINSVDSGTASNLSKINGLIGATAGLASATSNLNSSINILNGIQSNYAALTSTNIFTNTNSISGSGITSTTLSARLILAGNFMVSTASLNTLISSLGTSTGGLAAATANLLSRINSVDSGTASNLLKINGLIAATGNLNSKDLALAAGTGSNASAILLLQGIQSNYAVLSATNIFTNSNSISASSITARNTLSAQTILAGSITSQGRIVPTIVSLTNNTIPKFDSSNNTITNSNITDDNNKVSVAINLETQAINSLGNGITANNGNVAILGSGTGLIIGQSVKIGFSNNDLLISNQYTPGGNIRFGIGTFEDNMVISSNNIAMFKYGLTSDSVSSNTLSAGIGKFTNIISTNSISSQNISAAIININGFNFKLNSLENSISSQTISSGEININKNIFRLNSTEGSISSNSISSGSVRFLSQNNFSINSANSSISSNTISANTFAGVNLSYNIYNSFSESTTSAADSLDTNEKTWINSGSTARNKIRCYYRHRNGNKNLRLSCRVNWTLQNVGTSAVVGITVNSLSSQVSQANFGVNENRTNTLNITSLSAGELYPVYVYAFIANASAGEMMEFDRVTIDVENT